MYGTVKEIDYDKGYGYIINDISDNIYFHYTEIINKGKQKLKKGDQVVFKLEKNSQGYVAKKVLKRQ